MGRGLVAMARQLNRTKRSTTTTRYPQSIDVAGTAIIHSFVQAAHFIIRVCHFMKHVIITRVAISNQICHFDTSTESIAAGSNNPRPPLHVFTSVLHTWSIIILLR